MGVGVVIPVYNEAEWIRVTVRAVRSLPEVAEIVVVDDGSTDESGSEALRAGARVVRHGANLGKGHALKTGFQSIESEFVAVVDADMGERAVEIRKLIEPVLKGTADMTVAVLPPPAGKAGFGLVKGLARWGIRRLTGFEAAAPLSGQRVLRKSLAQQLDIAPGFGAEVAMTIDALRTGHRVVEVPVAMQNREHGRTFRGMLHRGRQFLHVLQALVERFGDSPVPREAEQARSGWR